MHEPSRRAFLATLASATAAGCAKPADWCDEPQWTDDGDADCGATASQIEGPFYRDGAPERGDLDLYGDEGQALHLSGVVHAAGYCDEPIEGAVVDLWHANPEGEYDNKTDAMRYRGRVTTDADGRFAFTTLLPGLYLNGTAYRPKHLHVKVWVDGEERLTTQLYFEGDPYLPCDPYANTSLIAPVEEVDGLMRVAYDIGV